MSLEQGPRRLPVPSRESLRRASGEGGGSRLEGGWRRAGGWWPGGRISSQTGLVRASVPPPWAAGVQLTHGQGLAGGALRAAVKPKHKAR